MVDLLSTLRKTMWCMFHQGKASKQCPSQKNRPETLALILLSLEQCESVTLLMMRAYETTSAIDGQNKDSVRKAVYFRGEGCAFKSQLLTPPQPRPPSILKVQSFCAMNSVLFKCLLLVDRTDEVQKIGFQLRPFMALISLTPLKPQRTLHSYFHQ